MTTASGAPATGGRRAAFRSRARVGARGDALAAARGLFLALALLSGIVALLQALTATTAMSAVLTVASSVVLTGGLLRTARSKHQGWLTEAVDVAALGVFAYAADPPTAVSALVISRLWFRALYGITLASVVRPFAYAGALLVALMVPSAGPGLGTDGSATVLVWTFPIMLFTAAVARLLSTGVHAGAVNARLGAIQVHLGTGILGETDHDALVLTGWQAHAGLCDVFPKLRLLMVTENNGTLEVLRTAGTFSRAPEPVPLPQWALEVGPMRRCPPTDPSVAVLDAAVGAPCVWVWLAAPDLTTRGQRAWFVLGAPGEVPERAAGALASQMVQMDLALQYRAAHEQLSAQANEDQLTGLRNRSSFLAELTATLDLDRGEALSVLFIDLDGFKEINDLFGHRTGDLLLSDVARRLRATTQPSAVCARIGGDEFGVLLRGAGAEQAAATAHHIAQALAAATRPDGSPAHIGVCIGIATSDGGVDAGELVHRADIAMYASKSMGKGRISAFDDSLPRRDLQQAAFERELADAARAGQLVVHYQPVISYPGRRCTAVEALVRWQHPDQGLLAPDRFVHTAERTGAIRSIGAAVLREALRDVARWRREIPEQAIAVHVNISALQLEDDDLLDQVRDLLEEFSLAPDALVLEVTESLAIASPGAVRRLHTLAGRGVVLAIDDFGTGYSALQTLRSLPITIVKIDRSFVAGSSHNAEDRAVTEAIVQMAGQLGLTTIAEGVENAEQQAFVESIGATGAQGYLYRRPGTAEEFTAWFTEQLRTQRVVPRQASGGSLDR